MSPGILAFKPRTLQHCMYMSVMIIFTLLFNLVVYIYANEETQKLSGKIQGSKNGGNFYLYSNISRPSLCTGCFRPTYQLNINNNNICGHANMSIEVLILIISKFDHFEQRNTIRKTWLTPISNNTGGIRYVFILGKGKTDVKQNQIENEHLKHKDIVQLDFHDSYDTLTIKSILSFKWTLFECQVAKFILKTDDDTYINIKGLQFTVIKYSKHLKLRGIGGLCMQNQKPIRDTDSKWYVPNSMYPKTTYPTYCSGSAYITGYDIMKQIVSVSQDTPFFPMEDVYIGLVLQHIGLSMRNLVRFHGQYIANHCLYKRVSFVSAHKMTSERLLNIWNSKCE